MALAAVDGHLVPLQVLRELETPASPQNVTAQGKPTFFSQFGQDHCLIERIFKHARGLYYIDLAANDAMRWSNTYALDRYWKWNGLCIEPVQQFTIGFARSRTCTLAQVPVGNGEEVEFQDDHRNGLEYSRVAHIEQDQDATAAKIPTNMTSAKPFRTFDVMPQRGSSRRLRTRSLEELLRLAGAPSTIDYLSLDVEGYEYNVLRDFPFGQRQIHVLTVERPGATLHALLMRQGYCVSHNANRNTLDIMYLSTKYQRAKTLRCEQTRHMPGYINTSSDLCAALPRSND